MMLGLSGVRTVWHFVWTDGTVTDGRPDGMAQSSGRLTGNWKSSESEALLNSRIHVKHLYTQVILSKTQNEAKILTNSPFGHSGTKITWPVWKYIPGPKIKITPPFCHKGTKGKIE